MSFIVYDLIFLVLFTLFVIWFLYKNRKNLHKEKMLGLPVYLYKTQWGMKKIDEIGKKHAGFLHVLKFISIGLGFILMAGIVYVLIKSVYIYAVFPQITQVIKAPPITPLIPYFPQLFGVQSFFPPFYFTYFILALAIVAIVHEFSHGIFMRLFKIKIKSTGFAFFGPFLGAFVEQDEKSFAKASNTAQMSVLSAGVFANIVFALIFFLLLVGFFFLSFQPAGYQFSSYAYAIVPMANITGIGNLSSNFTEIYADNHTYLLSETQKAQLEQNATYIIAYEDTPAVRAGISGAISEIDGEKIRSQEDLRVALAKLSPGDNVTVKTSSKTGGKEYNITLGKNPLNESKSYIGIGSSSSEQKGVISKFIKLFTSFKDPAIYYEAKWDGEFAVFIYDLLWWIMIINFLVGLFNMLPAGPFDGGRFFYLAILSVTKSKKVAVASSRIMGWIIGLIFILLMVFWFLGL